MYETVIGLEIHAQLLTATKMFCGCATTSQAAPNSLTCPVCLGLPGALPVLNERAVDLGVTAALALGCRVQLVSTFARKNYFYPDLPKGYQITQFDRPLALDGELAWTTDAEPRRVRIVRLHLEEDAGKSLHDGFEDSDRVTYLDFNRSGVPLAEIVTAPDMRSAGEAADFFRRLRAVLVAAGVSDGNMEQGSLRCDANVSVRPVGDPSLGVKTEVKNLNSFRFLQRALDHEVDRQVAALARGEALEPGTRLWDERSGRTVQMRSKEEAHDYRYFPEPDLPSLRVEAAQVERLRAALPELPEARSLRVAERYGLDRDAATFLAQSDTLTAFFERTVAASVDPLAVLHWIRGELTRRLAETSMELEQAAITPESLAALIVLVAQGRLSATAAKQVFAQLFSSGGSPERIARAAGLLQESDLDTLRGLVERTLAQLPNQVAQFRSGRRAVAGFLVGQVIKASQGRANPQVVDRLVRELLDRSGHAT